jgi:hypothetical protein
MSDPDKRTASVVKLYAIRLMFFALLFASLEVGARYFEPRLKQPEVSLGLLPHPYMMFAALPSSNYVWNDLINKTTIQSKMAFNNYGFAENWDYSIVPDAAYLQAHAKQPGERLVVITGGSVVHGVGATANDKTIAAQMMRHLNEHSAGPRYRVVNIGMGSWIAYQQFIGLSLFGLPLNPDYVIVMDAHNDAATACAQGSGVGAPMEWPLFLYLLNGGSLNRVNATLEAAAQHSALVRLLSGIQPATNSAGSRDVYIDNDEPDARFRFKLRGLKVAEEDKQVNFYLQAERNVLALFQHANVIFGTQPYYYPTPISSYRNAFRPEATDADRTALRDELDRYMSQNKDTDCSSKLASAMLGYFSARSALAMRELAATAQAADKSRRVMYYNTEAAFPFDAKLRAPYFIDNPHMSDAGQDRIGEFFAKVILATEQGASFNFANFAEQAPARPAPN